MNSRLRRMLSATAAAGVAISLAAISPADGATTASTPKIVHSCGKAPAGHVTCLALRRADLGYTPASAISGAARKAPPGYGPADITSAYKLQPARGNGRRVFIVDAYDDPNAESDLAVYRSQYGLPPCTTANGCFKKLNQNGATSPLPAGDTGWAAEISLDLDMVSATCPQCTITLIESTTNSFTNIFTAVKQATTLGAKFVSMSFGGGESGNEPTYDSTYFVSKGVVYTASTGDNGYGVIYPATSPRVVAVGGTSLYTASNTRGWKETAWSGAGSGCSSSESKPSWQSGVTPCSSRATADVAAVADPNTGVAVYLTYGGSGWAVYGGTSASAPIIASVYAQKGNPGASSHPGQFPYLHTDKLYDVTSGSNGSFCSPSSKLCNAGTGWDGPTGLGTPHGFNAFGP